MSSGTHYAPISGGHDVQDFEALEFHDAIMRPSEEVEEEEEGTRLRCALILYCKISGKLIVQKPQFHIVSLRTRYEHTGYARQRRASSGVSRIDAS
jgi:hypothetical protein